MSGRRRVVVATGNAGKLREITAILAGEEVELVSLEGLPPVSFPDEGEDYRANAIAKAEAVAQQLGEVAMADDSGIEVDALGGRPGALSARYGGPELDDEGRLRHMLSELEGVRIPERGARYVCEAAMATPGGDLLGARGICEGSIGMAPRGDGGFGYDPIFVLTSTRQSMAEMTTAEKECTVASRAGVPCALASSRGRLPRSGNVRGALRRTRAVASRRGDRVP